MRSLPVAILAAIIGLGAALVLSLAKLGILPDGVPGCSTGGGCGALTSGPFGVIPSTTWPWSFVGAAWFAALTSALVVVAARRDRSSAPFAIVLASRCGAVASAAFLGLMVALLAFCPWCAIVHACSLVAWIALEAPRGTSKPAQLKGSAALVTALVAATATSVALGFLNARHRADIDKSQRAIEEQMASAASTSTAPPTPLPPIDRLARGHALGAATAPMRVVLFTDYQCPDCYRVEQQVARVAARPDVAVIVKHFPLCKDCNASMPMSLHPDACRRAQLAEAAAKLGGDAAYAKAHRALFSVQPTPAADPVAAVVAATGFDRATLESTAQQPEILEAVRADVADAVALGVTYTPMVFVNGHQWKWELIGGGLEQLVDRLAAMSDAPIAPPEAVQKLVDDWRLVPRSESLAAPTSLGRVVLGDSGPEVRVWVDARLQGARILDAALHKLADEKLPFRVRILQFPASEECNPGSGFKGGDGRACLASAALIAAAELGGDEAFRAMYASILEQGINTDMASITAKAQALGLDLVAFQAMFSSGDLMSKARREADFLNNSTKATMVPTVVVDGRVIPRWTHPGADAADILRAVIKSAQ